MRKFFGVFSNIRETLRQIFVFKKFHMEKKLFVFCNIGENLRKKNCSQKVSLGKSIWFYHPEMCMSVHSTKKMKKKLRAMMALVIKYFRNFWR